MSAQDFSTVTELPGGRATAEQLSMLYTRYHLARQYCDGKDVLEVACGAGIGLGYLAREAKRVVGGDIDETNLRVAASTYRHSARIEVRRLDAQRLPFPDNTFDTLILYEAIYYLSRAEEFVAEARRVLRPKGTLLVCSVNREWNGFNPSPYSTCYFSARELAALLASGGFSPRLFGGFFERPDSLLRRAVTMIRRTAVRLHLIPKTMTGKEFLKRVFYGRLAPLGPELDDGLAPPAPLVELGDYSATARFKVLYAVAALDEHSAAHPVAA